MVKASYNPVMAAGLVPAVPPCRQSPDLPESISYEDLYA